MALGKWIGSALGWILSGGNVLGAIAGYCIGSLLSDATSTAERENGFNGNGKHLETTIRTRNFNQRPFEEDRNSFSLLNACALIVYYKKLWQNNAFRNELR